MIVCVCRQVTEGQIRRLAAAGVAEFAQLQARTGVSTQCGRCLDCARQTHVDALRAVLVPLPRSMPPLRPVLKVPPVHPARPVPTDGVARSAG